MPSTFVLHYQLFTDFHVNKLKDCVLNSRFLHKNSAKSRLISLTRNIETNVFEKGKTSYLFNHAVVQNSINDH